MTDPLVVDASVAAKWVLYEEHSDRALDLLDDCVDVGRTILVPPLLPSEITNVILQRLRRTLTTRNEATVSLDKFMLLPLRVTTPTGLYLATLHHADRNARGASYDSEYVAIAQRFRTQLWTADRALLDLGEAQADIRWIGDYPLRRKAA